MTIDFNAANKAPIQPEAPAPARVDPVDPVAKVRHDLD